MHRGVQLAYAMQSLVMSVQAAQERQGTSGRSFSHLEAAHIKVRSLHYDM
jgi:hypothetical protein